MQKQRSLWKLLIISFFAFLVVACKPIASFSVSPDPVKAGVVATFDASSTVIYNKPTSNAAKSYAWDFGDGSTGSGKVATHTYAAAGTFKVKLTVIDTAGRIGTTTENLVVISGDVVVDPTTTTLKVITQVAGGGKISGAMVSVGSAATGTSDATGVATLTSAPIGSDQVVKVSKTGFVTQSVRATLAAGTEPAELLVTLKAENEPLNISDIAAQQVILSSNLGASVSLPANALVNAATGAAATGAATLRLTPWDITGADMVAMPADGVARNSAGEIGRLISAGMMTVDFFDAAGNKLQLATGKSAVIQMDLPSSVSSIDGNVLSEGASIAMWHFDEANGIFVEEGTGQVISTAQGLAVQATVNHFSTWNWDYYKGSNSGRVTVSCESSTGVKVSCNATALVTLPGGSVFTQSASLPAEPTLIINMPASGSIQWTAQTASGLTGTATSTTNGTVVILLATPTTSNFVQCLRPGASAVPCSVTLSANLAAGGTASLSFSIPASGALIETTLDTTGSLSWAATSSLVQVSNTQLAIFEGSTTSTTAGNVSISLLNETFSGTSLPVQFSCDPTASVSVANEALTSCSIDVEIFDYFSGTSTSIHIENGLQGPVTVYLPPLATNTYLQAYASGTVASQPWSIFGNFGNQIQNLVPNQSIVIKLGVPVPT